MNFQEYIKPELLVLIPVLYLIGKGIKHMEIKDKYIPAILGAVAVALSVVWVLASADLGTAQNVLLAVFTAITQGILTAGAAVYGNELFQQMKKEE